VPESSFDRWANVLVDYSTGVTAGDQVAITGGIAAEPLLRAIYRAVLRKGAGIHLTTGTVDPGGRDGDDRCPRQHQHASAHRG
jgi:leucyl aminopeptidase (aminopeptidase T)